MGGYIGHYWYLVGGVWWQNGVRAPSGVRPPPDYVRVHRGEDGSETWRSPEWARWYAARPPGWYPPANN